MQPNRNQLFTNLILVLFRANGRMIEWGEHFAAPSELTSARWQMLGALALADKPLSTPQIALSMGVTRQASQKQLNLLVADGLIEKLPNPGHRRSPLYRLSQRGEQTYRRLEGRWQTHVEAIAEHFPASDLETAQRLLSKLVELHAPGAGENGNEA
ncbi:MAG: MarR family transcriptional regulator [Betaproteobacteria bacterium HGW-Betaproteobacteria-7]|jgi:DNA-binding MarR family transcriptional regulator|nr:MAG: MarR family transcriptional regulator [Betaproteobacteria bacterium HGW-Betaproteobacteria-7]